MTWKKLKPPALTVVKPRGKEAYPVKVTGGLVCADFTRVIFEIDKSGRVTHLALEFHPEPAEMDELRDPPAVLLTGCGRRPLNGEVEAIAALDLVLRLSFANRRAKWEGLYVLAHIREFNILRGRDFVSSLEGVH